MKREPICSAPDDINEEMISLIAVLHQTEHRLEILTAGEVDTVTDRDGRTLLLRRAQEHLRYSEAAKQAAILNALPTHIALLDPEGVIISVNAAWQKFAGSNAFRGLRHGVGENYLDICDQASGEYSKEASQVAAGIRSILNGGVNSFSIEYPCHSPTEQRWFLMIVTPLSVDHPNGVVVMHLDISVEKKTAQALRESERRFSEILENVQLVSVMLDRDGHITYCNEYLLKLTDWLHEEVIGQNWFDLFMPPELGDMRPVFLALLENSPEAWHRENEIFTRSGQRRLIRWNNLVLRSANGDVTGVASIGEDITERKESEHRIAYLNRVYAMLSGINTLIVRVRSRDELFREACRIAVSVGGFRMALIGAVEQATQKMMPIAWAGGNEEILSAIKSFVSANDDGQSTMITQAIKEKRYIVSNDSSSDFQLLFAKQRSEIGVRSIAVLPLIVSGITLGVLVLYASEYEFFHAEELKLVTELAGDIAFAVDHIGKRDRLEYLAYYDVLTGLANRSLFLERLAQWLHAAVSDEKKVAVCLIDLERFKNINDSLGRATGDVLLAQVAEWLTLYTGDVSLLARVGADQFAIVLPKVIHVGDVPGSIETIMAAFLEHPFALNGSVFRIAAKVGVAVFPDDGNNADTLFRNAEAALKKAKASGDRYLFYTQEMNARIAEKLLLENQLREAFEKEEFVLYYQPKVNIASGKLTSVEALIRWDNPRTGLVPPAQFIPILEEIGLIHEVGRWAQRQALADYLRWRSMGMAAVRVAVNVSPLQLRHRGFVEEIALTISTDPAAAAGLELEITESLIMEDIDHSTSSLAAIRAMGVTIAIDDFGTGFSSLSYLSKLPVDTLKIDRSFVIEMTGGQGKQVLVATIINLAHAMQLKVVAEGVETQEQADLLHQLGCDEMQGYLFSKPVPVEIFEADFLALRPAA